MINYSYRRLRSLRFGRRAGTDRPCPLPCSRCDRRALIACLIAAAVLAVGRRFFSGGGSDKRASEMYCELLSWNPAARSGSAKLAGYFSASHRYASSSRW